LIIAYVPKTAPHQVAGAPHGHVFNSLKAEIENEDQIRADEFLWLCFSFTSKSLRTEMKLNLDGRIW
jgi:hypothetical protein